MADNKKSLTAFEKENIDTLKKISEFKLGAEANIVSCIYKNPELLYDTKLTLKDFGVNIWRVYFCIANDIILQEGKKTLDDITVGLYLQKHDKLKKKFDEYGGYNTIENAKQYINESNFESYVQELNKWNAVIQLCKKGFPVKDRLSDYVDMSAEDIYNELEVYINHIFVNVDNDIKSYDICDGIDELIEELNEGLAVGLPYNNMPFVTKTTGGQCLGNITLIGGLSNVGKSTFVRTSIIPSIINVKEKIVVMVNEDGIKKWQRELLVWIVNNILEYDLQKYIVRDGKYSDEVKEKLHLAANWLKEQTDNHTITIIPFQRYQTSKAIKTIKKYANMGVKYFILDTFKLDAGKVTEQSWIQMQQSMVDIYDVVKPEALNVHIAITFQLSKGSIRQRYYTQDNVGMAKNIIDPTSTCLMIRDLYEDEYPGEKREVKVYRLEGVDNKTKIQVQLDRKKRYQVIFIVKNREGAANTFQYVIEHDLSRNVMKEIGVCNIQQDF